MPGHTFLISLEYTPRALKAAMLRHCGIRNVLCSDEEVSNIAGHLLKHIGANRLHVLQSGETLDDTFEIRMTYAYSSDQERAEGMAELKQFQAFFEE